MKEIYAMKGRYVGINLFKPIAQQIDDAIKQKKLNFMSRSDFVRYCIRKELNRLEEKNEF